MKKILFFAVCSSLTTSLLAAPIQSLVPATTKLSPLSVKKSFTLPKNLFEVNAGGYGGNMSIGRLIYSGESDSALPSLTVRRDDANNCYLQNQNVTINNYNDGQLIYFSCSETIPSHNNVYWDGNLGEINGGYSPENDALYAGDIITNMFQDWYQRYPLVDEKGEHAPINFALHVPMDNMTFWDNSIEIGDGLDLFYPLSSLNTIAYGVGSLFTTQHSNLRWWESEPGGIEVAFDCMTAMAAEFYATGHNTWQIGSEISKSGKAIHYMDQPSKNCAPGHNPGDFCDIDYYSQYTSRLASYYTAGLYNHAFYLLATSPNWDTRKAYEVFMTANVKYWKADTNLHEGLCGVLNAASDIGYDAKAIVDAFAEVGIDASAC